MANKFWVPQNATLTWPITSPTNWGSASGVADNDAAPNTSDNAIFDGNSGSGNSTINSTYDGPLTLDCTGYIGTLTHSALLGIHGSVFKLSAGMTFVSTNYIRFSSGISAQFTSVGHTIGDLQLNMNSGTGFQLQDNLRVAGFLQFNRANFDANNFDVQVDGNFFVQTSSGTSIIDMGSGTWLFTGVNGSYAPWHFVSGVGLTINPGTSTIKFTNTGSGSISFEGGDFTYNNIYFNRGASTGTNAIFGSNTFNDIKDDGTGTHTLQFQNSTTTNFNTWHVSGTAGHLKTIQSDTASAHNFVSGGTTVVADYLNISNSHASGGLFYAGSHSIDGGGNTGWIFSDPPYSSNSGNFFF